MEPGQRGRNFPNPTYFRPEAIDRIENPARTPNFLLAVLPNLRPPLTFTRPMIRARYLTIRQPASYRRDPPMIDRAKFDEREEGDKNANSQTHEQGPVDKLFLERLLGQRGINDRTWQTRTIRSRSVAITLRGNDTVYLEHRILPATTPYPPRTRIYVYLAYGQSLLRYHALPIRE